MKELLRNQLVGVMVDGKPCLAQVCLHPERWDSRERHRSTTVVWVNGKAVEPQFEHPGYGSDEDKAWRRYNREETRLRKQVFDQLGFTGRFSRKAGCSCGCSPGFVAQEPVYLKGRRSTWEMARCNTMHADVQPARFF